MTQQMKWRLFAHYAQAQCSAQCTCMFNIVWMEEGEYYNHVTVKCLNPVLIPTERVTQDIVNSGDFIPVNQNSSCHIWISIAVTMEISVLRHVTPSNLADVHLRFRGKCCLHLQSKRMRQHVLSVRIYQTVRHLSLSEKPPTVIFPLV
jgi:hypothetical protein